MKRFILLSFVFLGLGFYELSGGADFDPVAAREAAVLARGGSLDRDPAADMRLAGAVQEEDALPSVTRMSLNLTSFDDVLSDDAPRQPQSSATIEPAEPAQNAIAVTPVTFENPADNQTVLPSLIFPGNSARASSDAVTEPRDLRLVSASAVNMRGGPGTGFDVVTRLDRDTQVEVLQDDGTGWVRLRPVEGGPEGWIADFLLTGG